MIQPVTFTDWKLNWMTVDHHSLVLKQSESTSSIVFNSPKMGYTKRLQDIADLFNYFTKMYDPEGELTNILKEFSDSDYTAQDMKELKYKFSRQSVKSKVLTMVEDNMVGYSGVSEATTIIIKNILVASSTISLTIPLIFECINTYGTGITSDERENMILRTVEPLLTIFPESMGAMDYVLETVDTRVSKDYRENEKLYIEKGLDIQAIKDRQYRSIINNYLLRCVFGMNGIIFLDTVITQDLKFAKVMKK